MYIKLHQLHSEDALGFTSVKIHHVNVYVYEYVNQLLAPEVVAVTST